MWCHIELNDISEEGTASIYRASDILSKEEGSSKWSEPNVENMISYRSV
jgi:hypothetical protein